MQNFVGKQIDRYRIITQQGLGGMAVVYKAYDTRLDREVAVKVIRTDAIPAEQHERLMKRFEREAKAQAQFSHPNIVPVYDYGEVDGSPYLVMEYVSGGTLKSKLQKPVHYQQALRWLAPIADALSYAHNLGVVHRDVKPSNILFSTQGRPILTDFGIAKVLETTEATLTGTGLGVGTPEYMAPEQWRGESSEASDQYALGVVLYELLTGHKPFTAETPVAIALKQMNEPLRRPTDFVPDIPEGVEKALFRALALNPGDRFENMAALHKTLSKLSLTLDTATDLDRQVAVDRDEAWVTAGRPIVVDSEGETVDVYDPSPPTVQQGRPIAKPVAKPASRKKGFPKWVLWACLGLLLVCLVGGGLVVALMGTNILGGSRRSESTVSEIAASRSSERDAGAAEENDRDEEPAEAPVSVEEVAPTASIAPTFTRTSAEPTTLVETPNPEPTNTKSPTNTPSFSFTPTPKLYSPLSGCAASHLKVGDSAFISYDGGKNRLRSDSDLSKSDNTIGDIQPGEVILIIGGPECSYGYIVWQVQTTRGEEGWTPESDGSTFWVLPLTTWEVCDGALPARLVVGNRAKVLEDPPQANLLRSGPSRFDETISRIQPGGWMEVLEGPVCGEKTNWWRVKSVDSGIVGWTMEGDLDIYYLAPEP